MPAPTVERETYYRSIPAIAHRMGISTATLARRIKRHKAGDLTLPIYLDPVYSPTLRWRMIWTMTETMYVRYLQAKISATQSLTAVRPTRGTPTTPQAKLPE